MALFPEVQKRAQDEIDRVVGRGRLPEFTDRENLPYVDAVVKEALRWHPIGPMGLPHRTTADDVYNGYLIPKGSLILPNIWLVTSATRCPFSSSIYYKYENELTR
jgi:cytochrome P450